MSSGMKIQTKYYYSIDNSKNDAESLKNVTKFSKKYPNAAVIDFKRSVLPILEKNVTELSRKSFEERRDTPKTPRSVLEKTLNEKDGKVSEVILFIEKKFTNAKELSNVMGVLSQYKFSVLK